jgi:2-oxoglutarate ferredoxin oxidoreductase subunit beta
MEAIVADCGFVARSFAGDAKQVRELLKAAINYDGIAVLDIISPCVTFNNHEESTKSYPYGKANEERLHDITFIPKFDEVQVDYEEGTTVTVQLHDGPAIQLKKLDREYDPTDKAGAIRLLLEAQANQEFITGLIYINTSKATFQETLDLPEMPLAHLGEEDLRPSRQALDKVMDSFM